MNTITFKINIPNPYNVFGQKQQLMKRGILMFAAGHSFYGKMAAALAASIKLVEQFPIALLYQGNAISSLTEKEKNLFDKLIPLADEYVYNNNGSFNPIKARLYFYEMTPFQETLAIDADNVWLNRKKPSEVFNEMAMVPFTIQNAGSTLCDEKADQYFSVWANIQDVIKAYKLEGKKFYKTFGEWIFFKKSAEAKKLFTAARKIFLSKPKCSILEFIGQTIPDELAFTIAMAQKEIYPHKDSYHPTTYYHIVSKRQNRYAQITQLSAQYYTISMGGSTNPFYSIHNYNLLVSAAYHKLGLQNPFQWRQKKTFLEERKTA